MQLYALERILTDNLSVRKVEYLTKKLISEGMPGRKSFTIKTKKTANSNLNDVEDKLRKIFGTKVQCKQDKKGGGEIIIEFFSNEELERLFELFEIIDSEYN